MRHTTDQNDHNRGLLCIYRYSRLCSIAALHNRGLYRNWCIDLQVVLEWAAIHNMVSVGHLSLGPMGSCSLLCLGPHPNRCRMKSSRWASHAALAVGRFVCTLPGVGVCSWVGPPVVSGLPVGCGVARLRCRSTAVGGALGSMCRLSTVH